MLHQNGITQQNMVSLRYAVINTQSKYHAMAIIGAISILDEWRWHYDWYC